MTQDPYEILGVAKTASQDEIKKAYRKLAKTHHPDLHAGDETAEQRFKEISQAYALLGDADKRGRYDRGEIDASGQERPQHPFHDPGGHGPGGFRYETHQDQGDLGDLGDLFSGLFGARGFRGHGGFESRGMGPFPGQDIRYELAVDFLDAVKGAKRRVAMTDGKGLDITLPKGLRDGQTIRLKGKGLPGSNGGAPGDALVTITVRPHSTFRRDGDDIHMTQPIPLVDAVLGGKIQVPTIDGSVALTVPENSSSGRVLRLKGRGVKRDGKPAGSLYVTLQIVLPSPADPDLAAFLRRQRDAGDQSDESLAA